jgi:ribokinase
VDYRLGGKGGNQALAAARAGARVAFAGRIGDDDPGGRMRADLAASGVELSGLGTGAGASGMSVAITTATGEYGAVIVSGENLCIDLEELHIPDGCRMILTQNEIAPATLAALPALARGAGADIWLNAAPSEGLPEALLREVDGLIVNRLEACDLLGCEHLAPGEMVEALAARASGATVILTLGADGVAFAERGKDVRFMPAPKVEVRSTHGAGDMFAGSLAAALLRAEDLDAAIAFAQDRAADLIASVR